MKLSKPIVVLITLICVATLAFVIYGLRTDCDHTAGYVDCSVPDNSPN